jgi:hypothetical protein
MTTIKKNKPKKPGPRPKKGATEQFRTLDDLVVDRSLPPVRVKVFPSRKKSKTKPIDQTVIELQCEV